MSYITTVKFNRICKDYEGEERIQKLAQNLRLDYDVIKKERDSIDKILDFVSDIDQKCHEYIHEEDDKGIFFATTMHSHIPSDMRSIILLELTGHSFQLNIILRHLIENFIVTLWGDIFSQFRNTFDYLLWDAKWKSYRKIQRVTWELNKNLPKRSIRERLERIRLLNVIESEGKEFYQEYFSKCSGCDVTLLFALPICVDCMKINKDKVNFSEFHLDPKVRALGKEDKHAIYRTDFSLECAFCGKQKLSQGYAHGIPEPSDMLDMLIAITDNELAINFAMLRKLYSYLSEDFVHFSLRSHPDKKPKIKDFDGKKGRIWGFEAIEFTIEFLRPIMDYYFTNLAKIKKSSK